MDIMISNLKILLLIIVLLVGIGTIFVMSIAISEITVRVVLPLFGVVTDTDKVSSIGKLIFVSSFALMITQTFYPYLSLILYVKRW